MGRAPQFPRVCRSFRPLDVRHQLATSVHSATGDLVCLTFNRTGRNFSERDVMVAALLRPLLRVAASPPLDVPARLTSRERDVLCYLRSGATTTEIAPALRISPGTVRKHLEHLYTKLGVHNRTAAVVRAQPLDERYQGRARQV